MQTFEEPVLVSVDNSEAAIKLIDFVIATFSKDQALEILHVQPRYHGALAGSAGAAEFVYADLDNINRELEMESARFLHDRLAPKLEAAGFKAKTVLLRHSSDSASAIGAAICKHAESIHARMLVLTKTSKSALAKFFTGSVTRYTLDHSAAPVLIC